MRKFLSLTFAVLLCASATFARNQRKDPVVIGFTPHQPGTTASTYALDAALTWKIDSFVPQGSVTLNAVKKYFSGVTGTLGATDLRLELLGDTLGYPAKAVTVQDTGDTVTLTAHPYVNGDTVLFTTTANGITLDTLYYVCTAAANTFQIDATSSACGAIVLITSNGTNTVRLLRGVSTTVTATPTGALWVEWTGFTYALTGGTQYYFAYRNMNGTPASNYGTISSGNAGSWPPGTVGSTTSPFSGWATAKTTDGGATYAVAINNAALSLRLQYSDGTYEGMPILGYAAQTASGVAVYGNREAGAVFTIPANATYRVACVTIGAGASGGTPTGQARIRLYNGVTLLATSSETWTKARFGSTYYVKGCFSSVQTIAGGATGRVVLSETTQSDAAGNYFATYVAAVEDSAASKALMPFDGSLKFTYTTDSTASPVVFTDTDTLVVPFALLLDTETPGPFAAQGSGGTGRVVAQ